MESALLPVYRRADVTMVRGEGCYLYDDNGQRYLDFATGIAVNALGHAHPHINNALKRQADILWLCSNAYYTPELTRFANRLVENSFADYVFCCSSGTEAVEAAIKITRKYGNAHARNKDRFRIITFEGGFHGRTMAGISAGGNEHAREGFTPLLEGFDRVAFNDLAAVKSAIGPHTAGILVEAIQGEGGIRMATPEFLQGLRALADEYDLVLICDEVQCGMSRSGTLFAFEDAGIEPDIATIAKGIGNGFPLAACLVRKHVAAVMTPGSHGSTYGGNPLACAVGNAVLEVMLEPGFIERVRERGDELYEQLQLLAMRFPHIIAEVRGRGLMLGLRMNVPNRAFADKLRKHKLLTAPAVGDNVIRILPPLIIKQTHIDEAAQALMFTCEEWS